MKLENCGRCGLGPIRMKALPIWPQPANYPKPMAARFTTQTGAGNCRTNGTRPNSRPALSGSTRRRWRFMHRA